MDSIQAYAEAIARFDRGHSTLRDRLLGNSLGCAGEGGEIADRTKKFIYHDHPKSIGDFVAPMALELGDYFWYGTRLADAIQVPVPVILQLNYDKLDHRHSTGRFDPGYHSLPRCPQCGEAHRPDLACDAAIFNPEKRLAALMADRDISGGAPQEDGRIMMRNRNIMEWASNVGSYLSGIEILASAAHGRYKVLRNAATKASVELGQFTAMASEFRKETCEVRAKLFARLADLDHALAEMGKRLP